jgi:hypothetical protein
MKKFFSVICLLLGLMAGMQAQTQLHAGYGVSLAAVTTTGPGVSYQLDSAQYTWQMAVTGTPSALSTNLEGSLDGNAWFVVDTSTSVAGETRHIVNKPIKFARCNITTYTGSSTTATCIIYNAQR